VRAFRAEPLGKLRVRRASDRQCAKEGGPAHQDLLSAQPARGASLRNEMASYIEGFCQKGYGHDADDDDDDDDDHHDNDGRPVKNDKSLALRI